MYLCNHIFTELVFYCGVEIVSEKICFPQTMNIQLYLMYITCTSTPALAKF